MIIKDHISPKNVQQGQITNHHGMKLLLISYVCVWHMGDYPDGDFKNQADQGIHLKKRCA